MEQKYNEILKNLKEETEITNFSFEKFADEFKETVKNKVNDIHQKLDNEKQRIIDLIMQVYCKDIQSIKDVSLEEANKKEIDNNELNDTKDDNDSLKLKVNNAINDLKVVLKANSFYDELASKFESENINKLLKIKDDEFKFSCEENLKYKLQSKSIFNLKWAEITKKNNNKTTVDNNNKCLLNVNSSSCYNYFKTNEKIKNNNVLVIFKTNIMKNDSFFYFGVTTTNHNFEGLCMCCNCSGVTYVKSNGDVISNSTHINKNDSEMKNELQFNSLENIIELELNYDKKVCYFKVNNNNKQGPFDLPKGDKFLIVSGCCNSTNGYIEIEGAYTLE